MLSDISQSQKDKDCPRGHIHRERGANDSGQGQGEEGTEFQFCEREEFWRWMVVTVTQ